MRIHPLPLRQSLILAVLSLEAEAEREPAKTRMQRELLGAAKAIREAMKPNTTPLKTNTTL